MIYKWRERKGTKAGKRILVCAPSNIVSDHLSELLFNAGAKITQVLSKTREYDEAVENRDYMLHSKVRKALSESGDDNIL